MSTYTLTHLGLIVLFIVMGILLLSGKGAFLIAGYNTMGKKERAGFDEVALCRFMGRLMFFVAFGLGLEVADGFFPGFYLAVYGRILIFLSAVFAIIYANTGDRFKKMEKK